ncbi:endo-1,4-beta-xylanase [Niabella sp. CC-SYL272]|uniref:endo-1,4-beta-xylanase n=1 Tax=Niabella agricola TaxID=2891571 RepID=UPI001F3E9B6E|nr:endo-1,4-beta-xylanase [Niabella agricola]MCF3107717.1 endo-1,4-beta-xylanase [Niabella agricola]
MLGSGKKILAGCAGLAMLASCAKFSQLTYEADMPETILVQQSIDSLAGLKSYINPGSNPGFKLGVGVSLDNYVNKTVMYRLVNSNFDELVPGYELKHGAVVQADGSLNLTKVIKLLQTAKDAGMQVYGHTLTWHANQNATYLNGLITGASGTTAIDFEKDDIGRTYPMTGNSTAAVVLDPKGSGGKVLNVGTAATPANQSFPKIPVTLPAGIKLGNCQSVTLDFLATGSTGLFGSGVRLGLEGTSPTVYSTPSGFGATDNVWAVGKIVLPIANLNLTAAQKELNSFTLFLGSGTGSGNYYIDNIVLKWNAEKTPEEKNAIITGALTNFIGAMVDTCKFYVNAWDVVNEPMDDASPYALKTGVGKTLAADQFYWQDYMGRDYAVTAFNLARQHGNATDKLFINDYNLEYNLDKCRGLIEYVRYIESKGATVDGIGTQMHIDINTSREQIAAHFRLLAASGKLVKISELDIGLGGVKMANATTAQYAAQAEMYRYVLETYFELVPAAQRYGITLWSPLDSPADSGWRPGEPVGVWTGQYTRKLAYKAVAEALSRKSGN